MSIKQWILEHFFRDLLEEKARQEEQLKTVTAERDTYKAELDAMEAQHNIITADYENRKLNPNARPIKVPHCQTCRHCKRHEAGVGRVIFSCTIVARRINVNEGRTSPKWCPLRKNQTGGKD